MAGQQQHSQREHTAVCTAVRVHARRVAILYVQYSLVSYFDTPLSLLTAATSISFASWVVRVRRRIMRLRQSSETRSGR